MALKSLTHVANSDVFTYEDARREATSNSASPVNYYRGEFWADDETDLLSQELRLQSNNDGAVNWTVGALYWKEDVESTDGSINCAEIFFGAPTDCGVSLPIVVPNDAAGNADLWERDTTHWSAYALVEWEFIENWRAILEGRYTDEELDVSGPDRGDDPYSAGPTRPRAYDFGAPPVPESPGPGPDLGPGSGVEVGNELALQPGDDVLQPQLLLLQAADPQLVGVRVPD